MNIPDTSNASNELQKLVAEKDRLTLKIRDTTDPIEKKTLIEQCKSLGQKIKKLKPPQKPLTEIQKKQNTQNTQNRVKVICENCQQEFDTSSKTRIPIVYCRDCRVERNKDILEWVTADSYKCYQEHEQNAAEELLSLHPSQFRLDLHKTLDTVDPKEILPPHTCCVSYVGSLTQTRINARVDIQNRIHTGQLEFGVLVFKRGSHKDPEEANRFQQIGSKAWFNRCVPGVKGRVSVFIDDSLDHVLSVQSVGIQSQIIIERKNLLKMIDSLDTLEK